MIGRLSHRGPDSSGLWSASDGRVCFGHRRLAILDTSAAGHQPMVGDDGLAVTYNGEIYNFREVAACLEQHGARFSSHSDTEVLLAAYRQWGTDCLGHFNGMFAFAIFDAARGTVFLARDRFGEKPLLVTWGSGWFAFASEYKALFALEGVNPDPHAATILAFLARPAASMDLGPDTPFAGIFQLCPGESMLLDVATLSGVRRTYWRAEARSNLAQLPPDEAADAFRDLLEDSVRLRLRSDVPVGSCLSGGLDSSAIVCLARRLRGEDQPYHVFSGRFPGTPADEGDYIAAAADAAGVIRHDVMPTAAGFLDELPSFLWHNELPVDSGSQYAQWCVFRQARRDGVIVLLDGQGADELLGGYEQFFAAYLAELKARGENVAGEEAAIRARYPGALSERDGRWKARLPLGTKRLLARISGRGSDLMLGVHPGFRPLGGAPAAGSLAATLRDESFGGFLTTLLRYGDRNSMAHSVEVRLPFCDHRIAEFSLSLGARALMGDAQTKRLLRQGMRGILPETIRTRWRKHGFLPPHELWLRQGVLDAMEAVFNDPAFTASPLWRAEWWRACVRRFRAGETGLASSMWKPFVAEAWRVHVLERLRGMPRVSAVATVGEEACALSS